ncbi:MAG: prolipoprotein diacylglyceryl transferase [Bacillota bacterium]|nr:prolipoprotein diacylglyceryl transferase [Bacillota bacterium]
MITKIGFPKLSLNFEFNRIAIKLPFLGGGIYWYALFICLGVILGFLYVAGEDKKYKGNYDDILNMIIYGLPASIICARIYYVLFRFDEYRGHLLDIFKVWEGGIAVYGSLIGALIVVLIYCSVKKLSILHYFDLAAMGFLIGQAVGRWGNFVNGEAHGGVTNLPWGMTLGSSPITYHPTFLYESLLILIGFSVIHLITRKDKKYNGFRFYCYMVWYGIVRFFIEGLRTDSLYLFSTGIRVSQLLSLLLVIAGIISLLYNAIKRKNLSKNAF